MSWSLQLLRSTTPTSGRDGLSFSTAAFPLLALVLLVDRGFSTANFIIPQQFAIERARQEMFLQERPMNRCAPSVTQVEPLTPASVESILQAPFSRLPRYADGCNVSRERELKFTRLPGSQPAYSFLLRRRLCVWR